MTMNMTNKDIVETFGCRLNTFESEIIKSNLLGTSERQRIVFNTCAVTAEAERQARQAIRKARRVNPDAEIIVTGCSAQLNPTTFENMPEVDRILGNEEKLLPDVWNNDASPQTLVSDIMNVSEVAPQLVAGFENRVRAFVQVQQGCDHRCTFCIIPFARGNSRSIPIGKLVEQTQKLIDNGYKEIVLTGVNIGDYGKGEFGNKKHEHTFLELVKELDKVEGIHRLRISSIEPNLLKDETIDFVAGSKTFVPHFHIPLQSGSDDLLKLMKRRYLRDTYTNRVHRIKEIMPNACIGVDVIVGFPGETDEHFLETYNYLNDLDISYLHVFTYSERPNTEAVLMDGVVPKKIRAKRSKMLRGLSVKKRRAFYESQLGNSSTVLFESENKEGYIHGFTENYVKVKTPWNPSLVNTLQQILLTKIDEDGLVRFDFIDELVSLPVT